MATGAPFRVRRLAVIDLHGSAGSLIRLWLVRLEFAAAVLVAAPLGWLLFEAAQPAGVALGIILIGLAANYLVLAIWAFVLRRERLAREFRAHDRHDDSRLASIGERQMMVAVGQWRLAVPFLIVILALRRCEREV